jgi:acetolactate synthase I/II/III large subunit
MLRRAVATALSGRQGPVVVTVPIDVAGAQIAEPDVTVEVSSQFTIPRPALLRAADALTRSDRTVIFAGSGCRHGEGPARLREVAERLQCPVMTTPKGKGVFPEDHPLSLGVFGFGGHPSALAFVDGGIDSMLAIGTSLGDLATNGWSEKLKPAFDLVHVDIDANRMGRSYAATQCIAAPAAQFLGQLVEVLPEPRRRGWFGVRTFTDASETGNGPEGRIAPQRAIWEIQQVLSRDAAYTVDSGEHFLWATHYLRIRHPDSFFVMTGLGSMGTSIGAAMGIQVACPKRQVAAILGDGCFAMSATEIATAVEQQIPIHVFVINDHRLGMVEMGNSAIYGRTPDYRIPTIDVPKLAESLGARSLVAEKAGDILRLPLRDFRNPGPVVVDVRIDRGVKMPKHGRFEALGNAAGRRQQLREVK